MDPLRLLGSMNPFSRMSGLMAVLSAVTAAAETADLAPPAGREVAPDVLQLGAIQSRAISESSGLAASRRYPGTFWTHNDRGSRARLFAITRDGKLLKDFRLDAVALSDWEDIAIDGEGHLYLGDVGNNNETRTEIAVHQIAEPDPKSDALFVRPARTWRLRYPDQPFDCESLVVHQGHGYVISKVFKDQKAELYRFPLSEQQGPFTLEFVARLPIDSPVTGADLSADGNLLAVVCKAGAYVFRVEGDLTRAGKVKPKRTKFRHESIEACCFVPEGLLATAESREIYLFTDPAFRPGQ
jgi:hypothetical protein